MFVYADFWSYLGLIALLARALRPSIKEKKEGFILFFWLATKYRLIYSYSYNIYHVHYIFVEFLH